jgi:hypothetical protein
MYSYLPHIIYSIALTSISTHLLIKRKAVAEERANVTAQISILESIVQQLRSDLPISEDKLERMKRLSRAHKIPEISENGSPNNHVKWGDVFLGNKTTPESSELEKKDLETSTSTTSSVYCH